MDLRPLKEQLKAHIDKLSRVKDPNQKILDAINTLRRTQSQLTVDCEPTMELELGGASA